MLLSGSNSFWGFYFLHSQIIKTKSLFGKLSIAARKAIIKKWLKLDTSSVEDWYDIIYDIFIMERVTFSTRLQETTFEEI